MKTKDSILKNINEIPGITLMELSRNIFGKKSNISIHIKKLEKEKLIIKYMVEDKKKNFRLHPTKKGKEIYLKAKLESILKISRESS